MDQITTIVMVAVALVSLVVGYILGYRNGSVVGELNALKSQRSRHERGRSRTGSNPSQGDE